MAATSVVAIPATIRDESLHNLPVKITSNATAAQLKDQWIQDGDADTQQAFLRGRLLRGATVPLPEGYRGLLVRSSGSQISSDECQRHWAASSAFSSLTLWSHDVTPGPSDPMRRALEWCALSNRVHAQISPEEVEEELRAIQSAPVSAPQ
ncbi:hypothetical protein VOLCADRAFT_121115 [Volvox carteri f. nagariensis]|uniref:Uncharacterized protein n=1 Tax=Volvox carteri f. nagariensis TaxID=3068 RepID=D8U2R2_VOLCA|nr:uncharacterized protein VOLCADRAFT_121115 [Volvox carteri f. nagariensis]EFJ45852.1 hypothetical protein VOLCADRAFT_121115 [Volvox carteri f. nagariensis]|eukprot:XP_002952930.1 hypothetical protein VOLCADRAFT_121115 [Volvox carteri f. nagariensis]